MEKTSSGRWKEKVREWEKKVGERKKEKKKLNEKEEFSFEKEVRGSCREKIGEQKTPFSHIVTLWLCHLNYYYTQWTETLSIEGAREKEKEERRKKRKKKMKRKKEEKEGVWFQTFHSSVMIN